MVGLSFLVLAANGRIERDYTAGCLDIAIMADLLDPGRVNLFERWESQAAVTTFRRSAPATSKAAQCSQRR